MGTQKTATLTKKKYHVASGDYFTGKTQPIIARAFLGTCIGIAVFDADNGIGLSISSLTDIVEYIPTGILETV